MINLFRGEYHFLSNFHILKHPIVYGWMVCPTSEHFFCALKTTDVGLRTWILQANTPAEAKARGRDVVLRSGWSTGFDKTTMHLALILKFSADENLRSRLVNTGNRQLIEGNWWHDNYWGNCTCAKCTNKQGLNNLGILLMQVRALFQQIG